VVHYSRADQIDETMLIELTAVGNCVDKI